MSSPLDDVARVYVMESPLVNLEFSGYWTLRSCFLRRDVSPCDLKAQPFSKNGRSCGERIGARATAPAKCTRSGATFFSERGEISDYDLLPFGSNYTFICIVRDGDEEHLAVYKPRRGEIPLWDFPEGTLYRREYAAYLLSEEAGWPFIPPTVIRTGPLGVGSLQAYVDCDPEANCFTFGPDRRAEVQRIALFDCVANNADRKAGHCLLGRDGKVWAIDHGLTFHQLPKLRTVIWDFAGQPIPDRLLSDLAATRQRLVPGSAFGRTLERVLSRPEVSALVARIDSLLSRPFFPKPNSHRCVPWPPV
jgi:hypothetical protein